MPEKTVAELRSLAKARGISGYSKMRKAELLAQLERANPRKVSKPVTAKRTKPAKPARKSVGTSKAPAVRSAGASRPSRRSPKKSTVPRPRAASSHTGKAIPERMVAPPRDVAPRHQTRPATVSVSTSPTIARSPPSHEPAWPPAWWRRPETPERAKFAGPGVVAASDPRLHEDIDTLPPLRRRRLVLFPQKPGVLHAYWTLGSEQAPGPLFLRLGRSQGTQFVSVTEVPVAGGHGNYYFHISADIVFHDALVQLGYYRDGQFITLMQSGLTRLAHKLTAPGWWLSEALFRRRFLDPPQGSSAALLTPAEVLGISSR